MAESILPALADLHHRHYGLTAAVCASYAEAASVCLSRHHAPPIDVDVEVDGSCQTAALSWPVPDERTNRAWNNQDDATEAGAYAVSLAAMELGTGLLAVDRAETRTGADYYMGLASSTDLERAYRLEVAGSDGGGDLDLKRRLKRKIQQTKDGSSDLPAIASVVGFKARKVLIQAVDDD